MTVCISCLDEECFICLEPTSDGEACCCQGTFGRLSMIGSLMEPVTLGSDSNQLTRGVGRPKMSGSDMRNAVQAGRARAEDIAPIDEETMCEWAMLLNAGGGIEPIVGCEGNLATDRHHGPDKSTLNNNPGINLHRICAKCHNRWHYRNDEYYEKERPADNGAYLPLAEHGTCHGHDRTTQASGAEVVESNKWWSLPVPGRSPFRSWEKQDVGTA